MASLDRVVTGAIIGCLRGGGFRLAGRHAPGGVCGRDQRKGTKLSKAFLGLILPGVAAASTSIPELSTTLAAVWLGNHQMAVSNILGTRCLELALFFPAEAVYRGAPILSDIDRSSLFAAALGHGHLPARPAAAAERNRVPHRLRCSRRAGDLRRRGRRTLLPQMNHTG